MKVIAAPGILVPKEHNSRDYITDAEAVDVPESAYYLRRLADLDLLQPPPEKTTSKPKGSKQ